MKAENDRLRARNAELVEQEIKLRLDRQEPVAWMYVGVGRRNETYGPLLIWKPEHIDAMSAEKGVIPTPLYAAPSPLQSPHTLTLGDKLRRGIERQRLQPITKQEGAAT